MERYGIENMLHVEHEKKCYNFQDRNFLNQCFTWNICIYQNLLSRKNVSRGTYYALISSSAKLKQFLLEKHYAHLFSITNFTINAWMFHVERVYMLSNVPRGTIHIHRILLDSRSVSRETYTNTIICKPNSGSTWNNRRNEISVNKESCSTWN